MPQAAPILLISPDGMLGHAFEMLLKKRGLDYAAVSWPAFDLTNPDTVAPWMKQGVRTIINCSAYTDVDGAEANEAEATVINGYGVGLLGAYAKQLGATLVHFSTDYVFDGMATTPYMVDHPISPVNAYGRTKALGEAEIRASECDHLIVRTSWLYAPWGKNFVLTMLALGREKTSLRVVGDQVGRPTSAKYLAERALALVERKARGTFHVTDGGSCSWHGFASAIMKLSSSSCVVEKCASHEFPRAAARPAYSTLDLSATEALLGPSRDWTENLAATLAQHRAMRSS